MAVTDVVLKRPGGVCSTHPDRVAVGFIHGTRTSPRGMPLVSTTRKACRTCVHRAEIALGREAST